MGSNDDFKKLTSMLNVVIAGGNEGGKADFLSSLTALHNKYKGKKNALEILRVLCYVWVATLFGCAYFLREL